MIHQIMYMKDVSAGEYSRGIRLKAFVYKRSVSYRVQPDAELFCQFIFRDQADG